MDVEIQPEPVIFVSIISPLLMRNVIFEFVMMSVAPLVHTMQLYLSANFFDNSSMLSILELESTPLVFIALPARLAISDAFPRTASILKLLMMSYAVLFLILLHLLQRGQK